MLDASSICDRLMSEADRVDVGGLTPAESENYGLERARNRAACMRHLADLAREYRSPEVPRLWSCSVSTKIKVNNWQCSYGEYDDRQTKTWRQIVAEVATEYGVKFRDIVGPWRNSRVVAARQKAMWRVRQETSFSLPQIGQFIGGRDHTTVMHALKRHQARIDAGQAS